MRSFRLYVALILFFLANPVAGFAQTSGITSGAVYTLTSKASNKLLNVSNASIDDNAHVDGWSDTRSDAQRWKVSHLGNSVYTLTNLASGKLLHIAAVAADSVNVDQYSNTNGDDVKWIIRQAGKGTYYIKPFADTKFSLQVNAADTSIATQVYLRVSSGENLQKWVLQQAPPQDAAPTAAIADKVFAAWAAVYNVQTGKGFWDRAEMMEIVLDAYEVTKDAKYKTMFDTMYNRFLSDNGTDWMNNKYNDDITWAVLFCVRGYLLTGNKTYLEKGKNQFDKMYARAFTNSFGGGLIWYETKTSKNACINGPAMVASCYLAQATGDSTYYNKAIALYSWSKVYLFNAVTGKVNDNVDLDKRTGKTRISNWSSTYNQGTYLGAATMLYKYTKEASYLEEAERFAQYTRDSMYHSKVMDNEDKGNDLPGFKGIFARYARKYTVELNKGDLIEWLQVNARVAYNNRNSQNIIHTKWGTRTSEITPKGAFGSSTAVSLLINCPPAATSK